MTLVRHRFRARFFSNFEASGSHLGGTLGRQVAPWRLQGCLQASKMRPWTFQNSSKNRTWTPLAAKRWPRRPQRCPPTQNLTKNIKNTIKINRKIYRNSSQSNANLHSKIRWRCNLNFTATFKESVTAAGWAKPTRIYHNQRIHLRSFSI